MSTSGLRVLILLLAFIGVILLAMGASFIQSSQKEITVPMNPHVLDIKPGEEWSYTIYNVQKGHVVGIVFSVSGGNNDINFYIKDPSGGYIYGPLRVYNSLSYEFKAMESGNYEFVFDNTFSSITTKRVSINAYIKTGLDSELEEEGIVLVGLGAILLIAVLVVGLLMYNEASKTSKSSPTSATYRSQPSEAGAHTSS